MKEKKKLFKKDGKTVLKLSLSTLDGFCTYALSENEHIRPSALVALRNIVENIDETEYESDPASKERLLLCRDIVNTKINHRINNKQLVLEEVLGASGNKYPDIDFNSFRELNSNDVNYIESTVIPKYADNLYIFDHAEKMKDLAINIMISNTQNMDQNIDALRDEISETHKALIQHKVVEEENEIGLNDEVRNIKLLECIKEIREPSHVLKTGITMLNELLRGGFEQSREYCFFALPGEGKSTTLKEIAINILKHNKEYICRDKTKKPLLLYFSMENRLQEDMQLLLNMAGYNIDIRDQRYTAEQILDMWNNSIFNDPDGIKFVYIYKSVYSVTTQYIRDKIDQFADEGYETIAVIQDYMKRIMPSIREDDERLKLGVISNEFRAIAIDYQLSFITASQLNREGSKDIIPKRDTGEYDKVMSSIDSYYIGESGLINENLDYSIFLVPFWMDQEKKIKYLGFKAVKRRYGGNTTFNTFYQPYSIECPIKLQEDYNKPTLGVRSLTSNPHTSTFTNSAVTYISKDEATQKIKEKSLADIGFSGGNYATGLKSAGKLVDAVTVFDEESTPEEVRVENLRKFLSSYGVVLQLDDLSKYVTISTT